MLVKRVLSDNSKCVGCEICVATCSLVNFGEINPAKSKIRISGIDHEFKITVCNNCGLCERYCPQKAISVVNKTILIDEELCNRCGICIEVCPTHAIWWSPDMKTPNKCVACGACVENCPTKALKLIESEIKISAEEEVKA